MAVINETLSEYLADLMPVANEDIMKMFQVNGE